MSPLVVVRARCGTARSVAASIMKGRPRLDSARVRVPFAQLLSEPLQLAGSRSTRISQTLGKTSIKRAASLWFAAAGRAPRGLPNAKAADKRCIGGRMKALEVDPKCDRAVRRGGQAHAMRRRGWMQHQIGDFRRGFERKAELVVEHPDHSPPARAVWGAMHSLRTGIGVRCSARCGLIASRSPFDRMSFIHILTTHILSATKYVPLSAANPLFHAA